MSKQQQRTPYPIKVWNSGMGGVHYLVIENLVGPDIVLSLQVAKGTSKIAIVFQLNTMARRQIAQLWLDHRITVEQLANVEQDLIDKLEAWRLE